MGYRKIPTIYTLTFEQYEGLIVRMTGMKIGRMRKLIRMTESDTEETSAFLDEMLDVLEFGLVSWTLEDEHGAPLPASRAELEELDFDMLKAILDKWLDTLTGPSEELGKGSGSGAKFPGQPVTMEAL